MGQSFSAMLLSSDLGSKHQSRQWSWQGWSFLSSRRPSTLLPSLFSPLRASRLSHVYFWCPSALQLQAKGTGSDQFTIKKNFLKDESEITGLEGTCNNQSWPDKNHSAAGGLGGGVSARSFPGLSSQMHSVWLFSVFASLCLWFTFWERNVWFV